MKNLMIIFQHEIKMISRQAFSWLTPLLFFVIVVFLFPFALGPDSILLKKVASGIIWIAALLAILLSINNIFREDAEEGYLEQLFFSPYPLTLLVACKLLSHWLAYSLPLILISPLLGVFFNLDFYQEKILVLTLLLGTPVITMLGALGAALVVGLRGHGLLLPVLIMPLYIPVLIFGTGTALAAMAHEALNGYFALLGAITILTATLIPWLTGIALKMGVNQ